MISRRIIVAALATGATAAVVATASPAFALSTVTVTAGGVAANTQLNVTGTTPTTSKLELVDTRSNAALTCTPSSATNTIKLSGKAKTGTGQSPTNLAQITGSTWPSPGCNAAGTAATVAHGVATSATATPTQNLSWQLNVTATSSPAVSGNPQANQVTQGTVVGVGATVKAGSCTFTVTGSVAGNIKNGNPSVLTLTSANLKINTILTTGSCLLGQVQVNDPVVLKSGTTTTFTLGSTVASSGAAANPLQVNALA